MERGLVALIALLALSGCGGSQEPDWSQYGPGVQERVEQAAQDKDCAALQAEFDAADENKNLDLMDYVDTLMSDADCYG